MHISFVPRDITGRSKPFCTPSLSAGKWLNVSYFDVFPDSDMSARLEQGRNSDILELGLLLKASLAIVAPKRLGVGA